MDRCEELGAAYGMSPLVVLRLPWVKVEELWRSYEKRRRRTMKYEASLQGADISSPPGAADHLAKFDAQRARVTGAEFEAPTERLFDEMPDRGVDIGEVPENGVNKLKMLFPTSVEIHRVQ